MVLKLMLYEPEGFILLPVGVQFEENKFCNLETKHFVKIISIIMQTHWVG